jgi:hypothetical protein
MWWCEWRSEKITELTRTTVPPLASPDHGRCAVEVPPRHWPAGKPPGTSQNAPPFSQQPTHGSGFGYSQGVGKTTLVMRVFETLRGSHPNLNIRGFYTRTALPRLLELRFVPLVMTMHFTNFCVPSLFAGEVREGGERIGFEVVTLDGRTGPLSSCKVSRLLLCIYACSKFWY